MPIQTQVLAVHKKPSTIGANLRVTGHCRQGGRKYMEDFFSVAYQQTEDERDLEYAFFGIYDGHGGAEAAAFAKEHLMETIIKHRYFWSDNDEDVLRAIRDGYIATHYNMWKEQEKWPKTTSGLPSTAGTTASVAFIRKGKIYIGHVGDSGIILGYQEPGCSEWKAKPLTRDHKPENADEMSRIERCGGKVVSRSGVPRVVWNRPRIGHQGPVRRSTPIDEIPFLAVARSLGDLWSYNSQLNQFIVSPNPDCSVVSIDCNVHRCLIFGTDGLYNMLSPHMAVHIVQQAERHNENAALSDNVNKTWLNPSKLLVEKALERWHSTKMRADNTSVVTLLLDPPGPPKAQVLKNLKKNAYPDSGLKIMTRYENEKDEKSCGKCSKSAEKNEEPSPSPSVSSVGPLPSINSIRSTGNDANAEVPNEGGPAEPSDVTETPSGSCTTTENSPVSTADSLSNSYPLKERNFVPRMRESTSFDPRETCSVGVGEMQGKENLNSQSPVTDDNTIQINEISSSSNDILDVSEDEISESTNSSKISLRSQSKTVALKKKEETSGRSVTQGGDGEPPVLRSSRIANRKRKLLQGSSASPVRKFARLEIRRNYSPRIALPDRRKYPIMGSIRLSITQKIVKSKEIIMKKNSKIIKKPVTRRISEFLLDTVKESQLSKKPVQKIEKPKVDKAQKQTDNVTTANTKKVVQRLNAENQRRSLRIENENNNNNKIRISQRQRAAALKKKVIDVPTKKQRHGVAKSQRSRLQKNAVKSTPQPQTVRRVRSNSEPLRQHN